MPVIGSVGTGTKLVGKAACKAKKTADVLKVFRYISQGGFDIIQTTGKIPNIDLQGNPKDVFVTTDKYNIGAKTNNNLSDVSKILFGTTESLKLE